MDEIASLLLRHAIMLTLTTRPQEWHGCLLAHTSLIEKTLKESVTRKTINPCALRATARYSRSLHLSSHKALLGLECVKACTQACGEADANGSPAQSAGIETLCITPNYLQLRGGAIMKMSVPIQKMLKLRCCVYKYLVI